MKKKNETAYCYHNRRKFLKLSAGSAAGMVVGSMNAKKALASKAQTPEPAWYNGMKINPFIENTRVVFCYDESMKSGNPTNWNIQGQNDPVDAAKVAENMDKMAMALAQKGTAAEAWSTVFQQPQGKEWAQATVALKVNCIHSQNLPRLAVVKKIADELNRLGVPYTSMTIFDACHRAEGKYDGTYARSYLPGGVQVDDSPGGMTQIVLPDGESVDCPVDFAENNANNTDVLVNFALNKGHSISSTGRFTVTVKNHFGTLRLTHNDAPVGMIPTLVAMNQSRQILGGTPPRQQLCVVDSIWAQTHGPTGDSPNRAPSCLVMGTCGPIIDYLVVKRMREGSSEPYQMNINSVSGWETLDQPLNDLMAAFGYDTSSNELQNLQLLDALTYEPPVVTDTEAPSVPQNLTAELANTIQIQADLSWDASTDNTAVTGYRVYRNGERLADVTETSHSDATIAAGNTYSYTVSALDAAGNESDQSAPAEAEVPAAVFKKGSIQSGRLTLRMEFISGSQPSSMTLSLPVAETPPLLAVYNMQGQMIHSFSAVVKGRKAITLSWDGTDLLGKKAGPGRYAVKFVSGKRMIIRKFVLKS